MNDAMLHHFILLKDSISIKNKMFLCFFETATQLDVSKTQNLAARQAWTRLVYMLTLLHLNPVPFRKKVCSVQISYHSSLNFSVQVENEQDYQSSMTLNKA